MERPVTTRTARPAVAPYRRRSDERGVALILTLGILVLVTLLVIAFAVSMRVESTASKNFNDLIKARELARAGVDEAVGAIRAAAPVILPPSANGSNYVTAPGVIYTWNQNFSGNHWITTPLFTRNAINLNARDVDLNANNLITGTSPTYPAVGSQLWVGWSNVVANVPGGPQLVGRYAYWVDDESAKVDINVADSRGNDLEGYTPAAIDLWSLFHLADPSASPAEVGSLTNYVQKTRPLDTIQSMMMLAQPFGPLFGNAPSVSGSTFTNSQFYVTTRATSPDVTPWGDKRLNLSNVVANAASKVAAVQTIYNWLANTEDPNVATWFGSGKSFTAKYKTSTSPNLQQIAANIVDYITTDNTPTDNSTYNDPAAPQYLGLKETPYLNELVISNTFVMSNLGSGSYSLTIKSYPLVELWYMYTNSAGWTPPNSPSVTILNNGSSPLTMGIGGGFTPNSFPLPVTPFTINNGILAMPPSTFRVIPATPSPMATGTATFSSLQPPSSITVKLNPGTITAIFTSQQAGNKGRMDYAVIGFPNQVSVNVQVPATAGNVTQAIGFWAAQCNDPRVKPVSNTWVQNPTPTLGSVNSTTNFSAGLGGIPGDGDMSCHIVSANLNSTTGRQRGTMMPGELAYIHTGIPWRTFWLQPQHSGEPGPPDWALLDLFSATDATNNVVGRMNINQAIDAVSPPSRLGPLAALLTNLQVSGYSQLTATQNVYNYPNFSSAVATPATLGPNFCPAAYTMVGEIANTRSLSNFGTPPTTLKSVLETPVRDIANLITPRSNTFTIWCLAQSIKKVDKTPVNLTSFTSGVDLITGEAKMQVIVERMVDNSSSPPQVRFRTLYYRYLYQ